MKKTLIAALLVTSTSAFANSPFAFQQQFGSEEYVPGYDAADMAFAPVVGGGVEPSYFRLMVQANVDHIAGNAFEGEIVRSGPTRISLYEVFRDSPEGTAYRSYHERYAADHDWTQPGKAIVTSEQATSSGDS
jgi:hypothetical protein